MLGLGIGGLQGGELLVLFFIILLLFGAKRLPEMARSMGKAKKEFQAGLKELEDDDQPAPPAPAPTTPASLERPTSEQDRPAGS
jgi:sec-independent protein translocase protein TatA